MNDSIDDKREMKSARFNSPEIKAIQDYADLTYDGNFSLTLRKLALLGLESVKKKQNISSQNLQKRRAHGG